MKIYRIRSAFAKNNRHAFKQVCHKDGEYDDLCAQLKAGAPLDMEWNWGCKSKKLGDLIPSSSPGKLFTARAIEKISPLIPSSKRYFVHLNDSREQFIFYGVEYNAYSIGDVNMDHLLSYFPKHGYPVVSETFKRAWEENGFTGMTFEEVDEIDDDAFAPVSTT